MDHVSDLFAAAVDFDAEDPPGFRAGALNVGRSAGAEELAIKLFELPPGEAVCPYHYEYVEEWLLVLAGEVEVRTPAGTERVATGGLVRFPSGPDGVHAVRAPADAAVPARVVMFSSGREPAVSVYPDSDKIGVWVPGGAANVMLHRADGDVAYFDGETSSG